MCSLCALLSSSCEAIQAFGKLWVEWIIRKYTFIYVHVCIKFISTRQQLIHDIYIFFFFASFISATNAELFFMFCVCCCAFAKKTTTTTKWQINLRITNWIRINMYMVLEFMKQLVGGISQLGCFIQFILNRLFAASSNEQNCAISLTFANKVITMQLENKSKIN